MHLNIIDKALNVHTNLPKSCFLHVITGNRSLLYSGHWPVWLDMACSSWG